MSSVVTLQGKNAAHFVTYLKGMDPKIEDIQNATFLDVALDDGTQYKDLTFSQFATLTVALEAKNITGITYETKL